MLSGVVGGGGGGGVLFYFPKEAVEWKVGDSHFYFNVKLCHSHFLVVVFVEILK